MNMTDVNRKPKTGALLLAEPFMWDMNFKRSAILLCECNKEGVIGFILNRALNINISEALPELSEIDAALYFGGPVQTDTLHFLHNLGEEVEGSVEVVKGVYWGGNFEVVKSLLATKEAHPDNFKFFLGYSGWSYEQLKDEMKAKSWILTKGRAKHVFENGHDEDLWKRVLKSMGGDYKIISNFPSDPSLN